YLPVDKPLADPLLYYSGGYNAYADFLGKFIFTGLGDPLTTGVAAEAMNALITRQSNVYYYMFDWNKEPAPWNDVYGAAHAFDLPFFFGNFDKASVFSNTIIGTANEKGRLDLSEAMIASLSAFARTGNPNNAKLGVTWAPWPKQIEFNASLTAKQITVTP
ncbi:MAG: carboxylesterase family protein, partial [Herbaspirillum sp.]